MMFGKIGRLIVCLLVLCLGATGIVHASQYMVLANRDGEAGGPWSAGNGLEYNLGTGAGSILIHHDMSGNTPYPAGPAGVALGPDHNWYLTSLWENKIYQYSYSGGFMGVFYTLSDPNWGGGSPSDLAWGPDGKLYIAQYYRDNIVRLNADGTLNEVIGAPASMGIEFGPDGKLYMASYWHNKISRMDIVSKAVTDLAYEGNHFTDITLDPQGNIYTAMEGWAYVRSYTSSGGARGDIGSGNSLPLGVGWGPDGKLYVTDATNNKILRETYVGPGWSEELFASGGNLAVPQRMTFIVPEPGCLTILGAGLCGLIAANRRRRVR